MKYVYTTLPKMRRIIRDRYRSEAGLKRLRAARWLLENCNNTQLGNVFDLTLPAAITALKGRLQAKEARLVAWETKQAELAAAETAAELEGGE